MPVGDVKSSARGSGARYNDGKPDLSLIPLWIIAKSHERDIDGDGTEQYWVRHSLMSLGDFQTTGDVDSLDEAIYFVNEFWRDCAKVYEYGKAKYAAWNWAKGMAWSIPLACAARHALAILEGEEIDPESGHRHVGHFMCNLVMLRHFVECYPEGNDLPPPELFQSHRPEEGTEA